MEKLIQELRKEVNLLESWTRTTRTGGWSTQNLDAMEKRIGELKAILYDYDNKPLTWGKS